jgi:hypothetical protein
MGFSIYRTGFRALEGSLQFDAARPAASSVTASIPVASVDVTNDRLMSRLMEPDLLGGRDHPTITFKSTRVEAGLLRGVGGGDGGHGAQGRALRGAAGRGAGSAGRTSTTPLTTRFVIDDGQHPPVEIATEQAWECVGRAPQVAREISIR